MKLAISSKRVVTPSGIKEAVVLVNDGVIEDVVFSDSAGFAGAYTAGMRAGGASDNARYVGDKLGGKSSSQTIPANYLKEDYGNDVIMPGIVDTHVHINEPGHTDWEGFETATKAAAAGGVTALIDMPLNSIPVTTTAKAFEEKLDATKNKLWVDCGFYGGVIPDHTKELTPLIESGVFGFKAFLIHSGIDDFPHVSEKDLRDVLPILAEYQIPLLVHAELAGGFGGAYTAGMRAGGASDNARCVGDKLGGKSDTIQCSGAKPISNPHSYGEFLSSRPKIWENMAIELMAKLCMDYKTPVHIVHLSSAESIPLIAQMKNEQHLFSAETCPHYLNFFSEKILDKDTRFKCTPPIREKENLIKLWEGLKTSMIDFVVSDHSPCIPKLKHFSDGDFEKAWGGISSLQFGFSVLWTQAQKQGISLEKVVSWMCAKPASFVGLKKGKIQKAYDADLVVFDPEKSWEVRKENIFHKNKLTPYEGEKLLGKVKITFLRGRKVFQDGKYFNQPQGRPLFRR